MILFEKSFASVEWCGNTGEIQSTQLSSFSNYKLQNNHKLPRVELQVKDLSTQVPVEQTRGGCFVIAEPVFNKQTLITGMEGKIFKTRYGR